MSVLFWSVRSAPVRCLFCPVSWSFCLFSRYGGIPCFVGFVIMSSIFVLSVSVMYPMRWFGFMLAFLVMALAKAMPTPFIFVSA